MRRLLPLALLLLVACDKTPESPDDPPGGGDETPSNIQGSLVVHVPIRPSKEDLRGAYALLGDGSRFRQPLDENGDAHFEDPAIVGPQDVSIVYVRTSSDSAVEVYTLLGFTQPELWFNHPFGSSPATTQLTTVSGKVTGASGSGTVQVSALGSLSAFRQDAAADGTFTLEVWGPGPGQTTLFAREVASDHITVLRVGLERGVNVAAGQPVTGQDVALDHPVDQLLDLGVEGAQAYGGTVSADLGFYENQTLLFNTEAFGPLPLKVPTVARTPPFDATRTMMSVKLGGREFPAGAATAKFPVGSTASSTSIKLLAPMRFDSPTVGTKKAPSTVSRSGLVVRWSADPEAQMARMGIGGAAAQSGRINWVVWAPPSITSFTPFALPAEVSPLATFPTGLHSIEVDAFSRSDVHAYEDFFGKDELHDGVVTQRDTKLLGYVDLQ